MERFFSCILIVSLFVYVFQLVVSSYEWLFRKKDKGYGHKR